jgi:hypothetical protein
MILDKSIAAEKIGTMLIVLLALGMTAFIFLLALSDPL